MATTVYERNNTASGVGQLIGMLLGYRQQKKQQAEQEEARTLASEMMHRVNEAQTREEALAVSEDPKYQKLFGDHADQSGSGGRSESYLQDQITFGKMIKEVRPDLFQQDKMGDYAQVTAYGPNGEERPYYVPKRALEPGAPQMALEGGWSFTKPAPKDKEIKMVDLYDDKGNIVKQVRPGEETAEENVGFRTKAEFDNYMKLDEAARAREREKRLAAKAKREEADAAKGGSAGKTSEWEASARGMLATAGVKEPTPEQVNIASSYAQSVGTKDRQLRSAFNISEATPLEKLEGSSAGAQLSMAQDIYGKITNEVLAGRSSIPSQEAISIATKAAKGMYSKDADGVTKVMPSSAIPVHQDRTTLKPGQLFRTPKTGNSIYLLVDPKGTVVEIN